MSAAAGCRRHGRRRSIGPGADGASLEAACLHEYAHLAVARAFGACGFVRILRLHGSGDHVERYGGTFQLQGELGEREWRIVALAGTLAEMLAAERAVSAREAFARIACGKVRLSAEDAQLARGFDVADVGDGLDLLRRMWRAIADEAGERACEVRACSCSP